MAAFPIFVIDDAKDVFRFDNEREKIIEEVTPGDVSGEANEQRLKELTGRAQKP